MSKMRVRHAILGAALFPWFAAGCGSDDDGMTSEEKFCAAGESLESNVSSLVKKPIFQILAQ